MRRWAACIEYQGHNYFGWQTQEIIGKSVQPFVESALSYVADHPIEVVCAGRTDTGVHATVQVVHFDSDAMRLIAPGSWGAIPVADDIRVVWAHPVDSEFNARFSARWRRYHYLIQHSPSRPAIGHEHLTMCIHVGMVRWICNRWLGPAQCWKGSTILRRCVPSTARRRIQSGTCILFAFMRMPIWSRSTSRQTRSCIIWCVILQAACWLSAKEIEPSIAAPGHAC